MIEQRLIVCGLQWNKALLTMLLIRGPNISMPAFEPEEDILNIHCDIY